MNVPIQGICVGAVRDSQRKLFIEYKQFAWRLVVEVTGYAASGFPEQARSSRNWDLRDTRVMPAGVRGPWVRDRTALRCHAGD